MFHTQDQCTALSKALKEQWGDQIQVEFAMRYGSPSISSALQKLADDNVTKLLVLPLYPQYASSTIGSTFDALSQDYTQRRDLFVDAQIRERARTPMRHRLLRCAAPRAFHPVSPHAPYALEHPGVPKTGWSIIV